MTNPKFSIGNIDNSQSSNDNSSEGLFSKIKNLLTGRPNQQNERIRKKINSILSNLVDVKVDAILKLNPFVEMGNYIADRNHFLLSK